MKFPKCKIVKGFWTSSDFPGSEIFASLSAIIAVALLHPGLVATEMTGGQGISPEKSAQALIQRIDDLDLSNTGGFWHAEGYVLPW